jgi:alkylated DNA repair dioxygenase AlkB
MNKRKIEEKEEHKTENTTKKQKKEQNFKETFTITFGDCGENHVRMQKIGKISSEGFNKEDLLSFEEYFKKKEIKTELICLNDYLPKNEESKEVGYVLILRDALNTIVSSDDFFKEQKNLPKDKKALMYGKVVNKSARYNLCFGETSQEPDYENGKGTIVSFDDVPLLSKVRNEFESILGDKAKNLIAEGNYYFSEDCGIGFHGDSERRKVIGVRIGKTLPLHYQWFKNSTPVGKRVELELNHGDIYLMSEKAVGTDWKKKLILTLRHAAGSQRFLTIKKRNKKEK